MRLRDSMRTKMIEGGRLDRDDPVLPSLEALVRQYLATDEARMGGSPALDALEGRIAELDTFDTELKRQQRVSWLFAVLREKLVEARPIVAVSPPTQRCRIDWGRCGRAGRWTFDGATAPGCKQHAENARGVYVKKLVTEAAAAAGVKLEPYYGTPDGDVTEEQARAIATGFGVELPTEMG